MAIAAANLSRCERVATFAAPWNFSALSGSFARRASGHVAPFRTAAQSARRAADGSPPGAPSGRSIPSARSRKFAEFGRLNPASAEARRFVELEDWANEGEPLPYPAAAELIEDLFGARFAGHGQWQIGGRAISDRPGCAAPVNLTRRHDRIAPAATAPPATADRHRRRPCRNDRRFGPRTLHEALEAFLDPLAAVAAAAKRARHAPVAQLDRALPSEGRGQRFESSRARHSSAAL